MCKKIEKNNSVTWIIIIEYLFLKNMDQSLQKEIQEKQLVCVLNNTKWRELIKKIEHLGSFGPKCSIHYFFDARSPYSF